MVGHQNTMAESVRVFVCSTVSRSTEGPIRTFASLRYKLSQSKWTMHCSLFSQVEKLSGKNKSSWAILIIPGA